MNRLSVLLIGEAARPEFREAAEWLAEQTALAATPDIAAAVNMLETADVGPEVLVVAQSRPSQYSDEQIGQLRRAAPLAPVIALLGSWCEGELRTGKPWPGAVRIYWHQFLPRCAKELTRIAQGQCPLWGLPVTVTPDEVVEHVMADPLPPRSGLIAIRAVHAVTYESLADACQAAGFATVWLRPDQDVQVQGATAVIWDDNCCDGPTAAKVSRLAESVKPAPIVMILHSPRPRDRDLALAAGAAAIVSKPFLLDDLFWQLDRALDRPLSVNAA